MTASDVSSLGALGSGNAGYGEATKTYNKKLLESFTNVHPHADYWVQLVCSEFTSLCPKTGQPDIAVLYINYIPDKLMVESKSLKLYLSSFRNHGDFHEDVCNIIADDLQNLIDAKYLEVYGRFNPRGGVAIYPFVIRSQPSHEGMKAQRMASFLTVPSKEPILH